MEKIVIYRNKKYGIQSNGRYYYCYDKSERPRLLHRKVYQDYYGQIPPGYHVHHKDGDWTNNSIENLETVESSKHHRYHLKERFKCELYRKSNKKILSDAVKKAAVWHKSKEGREKHREIAIKGWVNRVKFQTKCFYCNMDTSVYFVRDRNYCSVSCRNKQNYRERKHRRG